MVRVAERRLLHSKLSTFCPATTGIIHNYLSNILYYICKFRVEKGCCTPFTVHRNVDPDKMNNKCIHNAYTYNA